jgi:hypothetical protein
MEELLNPYQKNSLRISLLAFEESLRQSQEWLDGRDENGILYERRLTISEGSREQANRAIEQALDLIEKLRNEFGLETEFQSAASIVQGYLTVNWATLMDTQANKLRRYGKVHPELAGKLDSDIQNLAGIALQLSAILTQSKQEKP